mgnify:CR=1 FL=1
MFNNLIGFRHLVGHSGRERSPESQGAGKAGHAAACVTNGRRVGRECSRYS